MYKQRYRNKTHAKVSKWLETMPESAMAKCPWCKEVKDMVAFFNTRKRKPGKVCNQCLAARRHKRRMETRPEYAAKYKARMESKARRNQYVEYLNSSEWADLRIRYWEEGEFRECFACSLPWKRIYGQNIQIHHMTYERFGSELLTDVVPMCSDCHRDLTKAWRTLGKGEVRQGYTLEGLTRKFRELKKIN